MASCSLWGNDVSFQGCENLEDAQIGVYILLPPYSPSKMIRGVPVGPINKGDEYWEASWTKFSDAISENRVEREHQQEFEAWYPKSQEKTLCLEDQDSAEGFLRYQRNLNQARVQHLTDTGLCMAHVLHETYKMLRRLSPRYERGGLGMPPLDFLMQRMSVSLDRQPSNYIKTFWKHDVDEKDINSHERHSITYPPVQSRQPL
ncbi:hypothetical protein CDEST_00037 [Colletotrichum destructivum]|uniref:Uncharacterized protein n=1 Tax=Colletotrichum destructivum TaxID=34406 RepID=A0AAX4HW84_9PEZI|nr:hypothetical protein CDEST_00037 [Colletotrichum destructivum]